VGKILCNGETSAAPDGQAQQRCKTALLFHSDDVIVDLARVTFVDSMTLGSLTAAAKRVRVGGGSFRVVRALVPEVRRAFQVTGLDKYLFAPGGLSSRRT
jgi:anti-anti-sigma factor